MLPFFMDYTLLLDAFDLTPVMIALTSFATLIVLPVMISWFLNKLYFLIDDWSTDKNSASKMECDYVNDSDEIDDPEFLRYLEANDSTDGSDDSVFVDKGGY